MSINEIILTLYNIDEIYCDNSFIFSFICFGGVRGLISDGSPFVNILISILYFYVDDGVGVAVGVLVGVAVGVGVGQTSG